MASKTIAELGELKANDLMINEELKESIYDIKTFDELLKKYYVIPRSMILDDNIKKVLETTCIKSNKKTNINLVRRGRMKKKLTDVQIQEIQSSKKTNAELGKLYGVSASTISSVKNGKY